MEEKEYQEFLQKPLKDKEKVLSYFTNNNPIWSEFKRNFPLETKIKSYQEFLFPNFEFIGDKLFNPYGEPEFFTNLYLGTYKVVLIKYEENSKKYLLVLYLYEQDLCIKRKGFKDLEKAVNYIPILKEIAEKLYFEKILPDTYRSRQ